MWPEKRLRKVQEAVRPGAAPGAGEPPRPAPACFCLPRLPAAGGRGGPSRLRRPQPPGRWSREVGAGAKEAETGEAAAARRAPRRGAAWSCRRGSAGCGRCSSALPAVGTPRPWVSAVARPGAKGEVGRGGQAREGPAGPRAATGVGAEVCSLDIRYLATAASGARFQVGDQGALGLSRSQAATAELEDKDSTRHFRCAVGKAKEPGAGSRDRNMPAVSGVGGRGSGDRDPGCRL